MYRPIDNFKEDFETQVIDRFVKGICKRMLDKATIEEAQVKVDEAGEIRYKVVYQRKGSKCEAVVVRTHKNTLELVAESSELQEEQENS